MLGVNFLKKEYRGRKTQDILGEWEYGIWKYDLGPELQGLAT